MPTPPDHDEADDYDPASEQLLDGRGEFIDNVRIKHALARLEIEEPEPAPGRPAAAPSSPQPDAALSPTRRPPLTDAALRRALDNATKPPKPRKR
ncbi:hypothetical protein MOQ72_34235 [Saccharopolyspora sp. K220]|uniref:hypothetical protein n=1 Tax=Saccharopolyspora soli TaxID=2926618 RepID=UPI001F588841|nr:hypothetical protein [Saccharopolyspora soli]MCI2422499.1 hypothetical protein [Saccharopolyspora soli]